MESLRTDVCEWLKISQDALWGLEWGSLSLKWRGPMQEGKS